MNKEYYIQGWLNGTLTEEESKAFVSMPEYQDLVELTGAVSSFKAPDFPVEVQLEQLKAIRRAKPRELGTNWTKFMLRVAASVLIIISGYFLFFGDNSTSVQTNAQEKMALDLPDASKVVLNAQSQISYNKKKWGHQRSLDLKGEAYFKVTKGSRFDVRTTAGLITVLGTQFNVKARDNYFEVICYEGLIRVRSQDQEFELSPNQMLQIINKSVTQRNIDEVLAPGWIGDESSFQSVPFTEVVKELERQYNVVITTNNVDLTQLFTGYFTHADIALALKSICFPLNLTYEITDDQHIVLSGEIE